MGRRAFQTMESKITSDNTESSVRAGALRAIHENAGAEFQSYGEFEIVSTFGEPQAEYSAIRKGCALMDLPQRGVLEVGGADRLDFLNRFLTNQTFDKDRKIPLATGEGVYAFLLNNKGRIVGDMNVIERGDRTLLETDSRCIATLKAALERFVFGEKVEFVNRAGQVQIFAMHGPRAAELLGHIARHEVGAATLLDLKPLASLQTQIAGANATVFRDDPAGVPGYFLIVDASSAPAVWSEIAARFAQPDPSAIQSAKRQLWPIGWAVFNAARIEAGRAMFGIDFDDTFLPAETGLLARAVSFTKGCYLGQEIVARMHARSQVPRQIVGIRVDGDALPLAGALVYDADHNAVGGITSSTLSPLLSGAAICLAVVKRAFIPVGSKVIIPAEGAMRQGAVVALPFI